MTDLDKTGSSTYGESWTQEPHSSLSHHEHQGEEETQHSTSASKKDAVSNSDLDDLEKSLKQIGKTFLKHLSHPYSHNDFFYP